MTMNPLPPASLWPAVPAGNPTTAMTPNRRHPGIRGTGIRWFLIACLWTGASHVPGVAQPAVPATSAAAASSPCPEVFLPELSLELDCSTNAVGPGGWRTFSGTLRNRGNVEVRNLSIARVLPDSTVTVRVQASLLPGVSVPFNGDYRVPSVDPCQTPVRVIAAGVDACRGQSVGAIVSLACPVATAPSLAVAMACPAPAVAPGGEVVCSGTVRNDGDVSLRQVVVNVPGSLGANPPLLSRERLDPGESASFTIRRQTSVDECGVRFEVAAAGVDACSGQPVIGENSVACPLVTAGGLEISQTCRLDAGFPGDAPGYDALLRNTGTLVLTNVTVLESQVGAWGGRGTELWFDDQLPDGAVPQTSGGDSWESAKVESPRLNGYHGWQSALAEGYHQLFFTGDSRGLSVAPSDVLVAHVFLDPEHPPRQVMIQWNDGSWEHRAYWGENLTPFGIDGSSALRPMGPLPTPGQWVRLEVPAGLVGLEGRVVRGVALGLHGGRATWDALGRRPAGPQPPVFSVARLEPGQSVSFRRTGLAAPDGACTLTTLLSAEARVACSGETVAAFTSATCNLPTRALLEVVQADDASVPVPGGVLVFRGTVRNAGPVALRDVVVVHHRTGAQALLEVPLLLPGESRPFSGNFTVPTNACRVSGTVAAAGTDLCTGQRVFDSGTAIHPVAVNAQLVVAKNCPSLPVVPGRRMDSEGVVMNLGDTTLVDVYVRGSRSGDVPVVGPLVLAPGQSVTFIESFVAEPGDCGQETVRASGRTLCGEVVSSAMNLRCSHAPVAPGIVVVQACPQEAPFFGQPYRAVGTVRNTGNVALVDVRVVHSVPAEGTPILGPITLQPGESAEYTVVGIAPLESCDLVDTVTASAVDRCEGARVANTCTTVCPQRSFLRLGLGVQCPTSTGPADEPRMLRGSLTNTGNVLLVHAQVRRLGAGGVPVRVYGPVHLAPGEVAVFAVPAPAGWGEVPDRDFVEALAEDGCRGTRVSARAGCHGPVAPSVPVLRSIAHGDGGATLRWDSQPGTTYLMEYSDGLPATAWIPLAERVTATGDSATMTDSAATDARRFYRVAVAE